MAKWHILVVSALFTTMTLAGCGGGGGGGSSSDNNPSPQDGVVKTSLDSAFTSANAASQSGSSNDYLAAADQFKEAAAAVGSDSSATMAEKDAAYFFSAFSRLILLADPHSSGASGLSNLGDILDAFGVAGGAARDQMSDLIFPATLPDTSPQTGSLQNFLYDKLATQLKSAISDLNHVSPKFNNRDWKDADGSVTEFDYADVLMFKGAAQALLGKIYMQQAYDIDTAIVGWENATFADFLTANPSLGKLKDASKLAQAKLYFVDSADTVFQAIDKIQAETDDQRDDLSTSTRKPAPIPKRMAWYARKIPSRWRLILRMPRMHSSR